MHWIDFLVVALAAVVGGFAARTQLRAPDLPIAARLTLAFVAGLGSGVVVLAAAALWLPQAGDPWNAARLAPALALHRGYSLYYPLDAGPVLSTVVGPVSFLAYWPVGFLRGSPTALILAACALNLAAFVFLARATVRHVTSDAAVRGLAALVLSQLGLYYPALRSALFSIHSDAPALALVGAGLILLLPGAAPLSWSRACVAALCFTLAVWAKQSLAPIFVAALLVLALRDGRAAALRFFVSSAATGAVVSLAFVACLGPGPLWMNMFSVPAHHPWVQMNLTDGYVYYQLLAVGTGAHVKVVLAAMLHLVRGNWPLFALFGALFFERFFRRTPGESWFPRTSWALFATVAVVLFPTAAIGRVKVGGEANHDAFSILFLVLAFACWLAESSSLDRRVRLARTGCVAAVLLALTAPRVLEYSGWRAARDNQNEASYLYERAHPGRVFFPWNPLASLLAEGRLYHFDYGVFDRNLGGAQVTPEHLRESMPATRPLIATTVAHHDYILKHYFSDYVLRHSDPELPGWRLYGPPESK